MTDKGNSFVETFFTGNEGISIKWVNLFGSFSLILVVVSIVFFFAKKLYKKKGDKN
ncbi:hypothetical protein RV18_GL002106 [Enterococcus termitis]|nr:hypothetical protein RV18_GL002106 [Enterococcus termitis]